MLENFSLAGEQITLVPLGPQHLPGLLAAARVDPSLYRWTFAPQTEPEMAAYIETALAGQRAGTAIPFAILRVTNGAVIGSTRFFNLEYWAWPKDHARFGSALPDACEIGYTWYAADAIRTGANTEVKYLMLAHAFEQWKALRVCFHTDARNERSRAAIERIGGRFEGLLRSHRMAADFTPRVSARYSIVEAEWPAVKEHLLRLRQKYAPA
ncbi:MAG: GNAT family protein [Acidobacteriaceae bacterium]|jgi:RimJ/RimL family protein N-acetyltransferase